MQSLLPKISIGLVTFNRASTLPRALESALCQTFHDFELIVSDDNSSDDTYAVVQQYLTDKRVRYIKRTGIGMTENFLQTLKDARGEYFLWLCDDDYLSETYLEACLGFMRDNPGYSVVSGKTIFFRDNTLLDRRDILTLESDDPAERVVNYFTKVNSNVILYGLMRRREIVNLTYPDTFCADLLWSAQVVFSGKAKILDDTNFFYSVTGISEKTANLKDYYQSTKRLVINPYRVLRRSLIKLIFDERTVFSRLSLHRRIGLSIRLWFVLRERFIMPAFEAKLRGSLRIRTRLKALFR